MTEWLVELKGERLDLQYLSRQLSSEEWSVSDKEGRYYLRSARFNSLTDARDVLDDAAEFLAVINGLANVQSSDFHAVELAGIARVEEGEKPPTQFLFPKSISARIGMYGELTARKLGDTGDTTDSQRQPTVLESWLAIADQDPKVRKALRILGSQENNWGTLRKVYEVLEGDAGQPTKIAKYGWADVEEIKRFIESASDPDASGDDAVHGYTKRPLHFSPMSLSEARSFIRDLLEKWIRSKCQ